MIEKLEVIVNENKDDQLINDLYVLGDGQHCSWTIPEKKFTPLLSE